MASKKKNVEKETEKEAVNTPEVEAEETAAAEAEQAAPARDYDAELAAEKDKYLRLAAEYDNYRRRSQKEREALYSDVKAQTITELLPVYDNLARALALGSSDEAFLKGIQMTMNQLESIFAKLGVASIPAVGETFDPEKHNAVRHIDDENVGENIIVEEFQKGFTLGDKVIRFAMVVVAN